MRVKRATWSREAEQWGKGERTQQQVGEGEVSDVDKINRGCIGLQKALAPVNTAARFD